MLPQDRAGCRHGPGAAAVNSPPLSANTPRAHLSLEEFMPLLLCATGALGVLPFAIIRFMNREWLIGVLDTAIVAGFAMLGMFVLRSRRVRLASVFITILGIAGMLATIYLKGTNQLYWIYPALIVAYYLLKPGEAVLATLVVIIALLPALSVDVDAFTRTTVLISTTMTAVFAYAFASLTRGQRNQLMNLATCDPLTGAGNRRALAQKLTEVVAAHERNSQPASLVILDLDNFKDVNDEFGHAAGDQILIRLTEIIRLRTRVTDGLYRIGGEEFVIVIDEQTVERAGKLAEQLRTLVQANELLPDRNVTISLGVAGLKSGESIDDWLHRADSALYAAKRAGRNATRVAGDDASMAALPV